MAMTCPECGQAASGNFCSQCGTALSNPVDCPQCGNRIPPGGRFCNNCGTPVSGRPAAADPRAPASAEGPESADAAPGPGVLIGAAGAVAIALIILFLVLPRLSGEDETIATGSTAAAPAPAPTPSSGQVGDPSAIDITSMTPEESALRLFNRVMTSVSQGDSASARQFAPMAIAAYDLIPSPDLDDRYHVAVLHLVNNDPEGARAAAQIILDEVPSHLFGLYTAAQAETLLGNRDVAADLYREFLANYDEESALDRDEYVEHDVLLPAMFEDATRIVGNS